MLPRLTLPPPPFFLALVAAAFILPGLAGHDLWKSQDAIALGIAHDMATGGDLIVPHLGGSPWLYDQPLYHWTALALGKILGRVMEFHAAARLASGLFIALAFAFLYRAARLWSVEEETSRVMACAAFLLLLGCLGLFVRAHEALPEHASLAAMALALASLPHAERRPVPAGVVFGIALGLAFLSAAWIAPVALALAVAIAHLACPSWRTRKGAAFVAVALVAALIVSLPWPLMLARRSADAFALWWSILAQRQGPASENLRHFVATASWFAWPAWPLAFWATWSLRRRWREPRLFVPAVAVVIMAALLVAWGPPQDENLVPLLAPLALLAAQGLFTLRRGAFAALDWFGALTFAFFTLLVWLGWVAMLTGVPGPISRNFSRMAPGFIQPLQPFAILIALALAGAWLYLVFYKPSSPLRSISRWAAGIVLLWGTVATLWMPWWDYQRTYRHVAAELRSKLPAPKEKGAGCLAQRSLGVSQAAALDYHGGIRAQPFDFVKPAACPFLLVQGTPDNEKNAPLSVGSRRWTKIAEIGRPGDRHESFRLYRLEQR
jgi:4-amino-4-deoxy-L-arabinose transferase-like glycosyltransferase